MIRAGPFPRWLWDPMTCGWLLLRADGTLHEEGGPGDPPMPTDPLVRLKLQGWREYRPDGSSVPIDPSVFEGAEFPVVAAGPPPMRPAPLLCTCGHLPAEHEELTPPDLYIPGADEYRLLRACLRADCRCWKYSARPAEVQP